MAEASRLGMTVVRRISGGGAMFIEPGSTITYSLYAPESLVAGMSYAESYRYLDDWVIGALTEDLGLCAWYRPLNDIASAQGKIGGAAQRRLGDGTVLHHVTMAYGIDADAMMRVLRVGQEKLSGRGIPSAVKRVDPLRGRPGCRARRSSTRWRRISVAATASPRNRHRRRTARRAALGPDEVRQQRVDCPVAMTTQDAGARTVTVGFSAPVLRPTRDSVRGLALASVIGNAVLVCSGAAVRLTSSGLGCPDWPQCTTTSVVAAHSAGQTPLNTAIEFGNRLLTFPLVAIAVLTFVACLRCKPSTSGGATWCGSPPRCLAA